MAGRVTAQRSEWRCCCWRWWRAARRSPVLRLRRHDRLADRPVLVSAAAQRSAPGRPAWLPYETDLLTLAVEAGLDFVGGLHKVVEKGREGPLVNRLHMVLRSIRLGRSRSEALTQMAERVDLPPVRAWVELVKADRMGTPLGRILRMQADRLRERRAQAAEKAANEAPVKLLFPLIFFIFPTVFLVLFGPIVFRIFFVGL